MVKSGWKGRKMTSHVMKCSQEDTPEEGRSVELRSGREGTWAARLRCCSSLQAWAMHPRLGHAQRKERKE